MSFQQSRKGTPLDLSDLKKQAAVTIEEKPPKLLRDLNSLLDALISYSHANPHTDFQ